MAIQLKRSLFIGLGGTGMTALLHTKKLFIDTFGEVPPMIGFLGIDTDSNQFTDSIRLRNGEMVSLNNNEQMQALISNPKNVYKASLDQMGWMPEDNVKYINGLTTGAGQVRTNGRFAFWYHHQQIKNQILNCLQSISNVHHIDNTKYEILHADLEIHVIFSMCGGTGAGMFLNLGYLIRQDIKPIYPCKTAAYAVLPDVFYAMNPNQMPRVHANAYGSLEDLDWLMKAKPNTQEFDIQNLKHSFTTNDTPYDVVLLIDNKNRYGDTIDIPADLSQMISLAMVVGAGNIGQALSSVMDNMIQDISNGTMNVSDKEAWAGGLGVSEIMIESSDLYKAYKLRASSILIKKLLSDNQLGQDEITANGWIDAVEIRENNGQDQVIDYLLLKNPRFPVPEITDTKNPRSTIDSWFNQVTSQDEASSRFLNDKVDALLDKATAGLKSLVNEHLNNGNGVEFVLNMLAVIDAQMRICLQEMQDENNGNGGEIGFRGKDATLQAAYDSTVKALQEYKKPFIGKSLIPDLIIDVQTCAMNWAINKRQILRRENAISFYNRFIPALGTITKKVQGIRDRLLGAKDIIVEDLNKLINGVDRNIQFFQIDLTKDYIGQAQPKVEDIVLSNFINSLTNGSLGNINSVESMNTLSPKEVSEIVEKYAGTLQGATKFENMSVDDLLKDLPEDIINQFVNLAKRKSTPLIQYDYTNIGIMPEQRANTYFYIGVGDQETETMKEFMQIVNEKVSGDHRPQFVNTGNRSRIIFYCQEGVIPPCVLSNIANFKEKAKTLTGKYNVHFDNIIENTRMIPENYDIYPTQAVDDSMELWIKSLMFGFVRNNNGQFEMKDKENGQAIDGYWTSLNNIILNDRSQAFANFRQKMNNSAIKESLEKMLNEEASQIGQAELSAKVQDVKKNFVEVYAQLGLSFNEIKTNPIYVNIKKQLNEEMLFVDKELHS